MECVFDRYDEFLEFGHVEIIPAPCRKFVLCSFQPLLPLVLESKFFSSSAELSLSFLSNNLDRLGQFRFALLDFLGQDRIGFAGGWLSPLTVC